MKHQYDKTLHVIEILAHRVCTELSHVPVPFPTTPTPFAIPSHVSTHVHALMKHTMHRVLSARAVSITHMHAHAPTPEALPTQVPLLAKCMSFLMKRGQKAKATRTMNLVLRILQDLMPQNKKMLHVMDMMRVAIANVKPSFELRKARIGGKTQCIPATMPVHKQENMALRALMHNARLKQRKASGTHTQSAMYTFAYFLAHEIHDAYKHQGAACNAKQLTHKQAEHNRNYVRRRWW